jgi:hypothetical protein
MSQLNRYRPSSGKASSVASEQIPLFPNLVEQDPVNASPADGPIAAEVIEELHDLIMAQYDMTLYERRIFLKVMELLPPGFSPPSSPDTLEPLLIDARELINDSKLKGESAFLELQKATLNLIRHVCRIVEQDGLLQVGLMSSVKYLKGKGCIRVRIDPSLYPYLFKIRSHFTRNQLKDLIKFRSYYTQCFYELFQKASRNGQLYMPLAGLRNILRIGEEEYERYYDFKRFVVYQAQKELKSTEFDFIFKEKRLGKKVTGIQFHLVRYGRLFQAP